jgi:hypothetical protein
LPSLPREQESSDPQRQEPLLQAKPSGQFRPQAPQFLGSALRSRQPALQQVAPVSQRWAPLQLHFCPTHTSPALHAPPPQKQCSALQAPPTPHSASAPQPHCPSAQVFGFPQALAQVPQLAGSAIVFVSQPSSVDGVLQSSKPKAQ